MNTSITAEKNSIPAVTSKKINTRLLDKEYDNADDTAFEVVMAHNRKKHNINLSADEYLNED